jgi:MFS family permease
MYDIYDWGTEIMNSISTRLWNKNFSLVTLCFTIAMLGNMTLSFALAYYVRDITGSEAMFGLALSAPYISLLIMSPIGGIMADRLKKQRIMFWIDVSVTVIIVLFLVAKGLFTAVLPIVFIKLLALNAVQGAYMSTVNAAVPLVVPTEKLTNGNAIIGMVNALAGGAGQALAAVLYSNMGLNAILIPFVALYALTSIMDLFIRVPYTKPEAENSVVSMIKGDITQAVRFISKDKPILIKLSAIAFVVFASVASMLMIAMPVLVTESLNMDLSFVGISQLLMTVGGLAGGIFASVLGGWLSVRKLPPLMIVLSIAPIPMGLVILLNAPTMIAFVTFTVVSAIVMFTLTLVVVTAITYVQMETPPELLGKVLSLFSMLPFLAQAVGQFGFGVLFEIFAAIPWVPVLVAAGISALITLYSFSHLRNIPHNVREPLIQ